MLLDYRFEGVQADMERRQLGEQFRVLEAAYIAPEPASPNRILMILIGGFFAVAVGAEWYPIRWLGVGGHTGLVWQRTDTEAINDNSGNSFEGATKNLRTFRSGLMVNFYFR